MLTKLRIQNAFVHKDLTVDFKQGLTAIVGKNGKGKSLILEMARYGLWGTKALRGMADDYKKLAVDLWFELKGMSLHVARNPKGALLTQVLADGKEIALASGTTPVNAKIIALFGYNMDVFDISNAANQGEISKLSTMRPTERKAMVDKTVGLHVIDALEKFIADELKNTMLVLGTKREGHYEPEAPVKPEDYAPLAELDAKLAELRQNLKIVDILRSQAEAVIEIPTAPAPVELPFPLAELRTLHEAYKVDQAERHNATRQLAGLPKPQEPVELIGTDVEYDALAIELSAAKKREAERATLIRLIGNTPVKAEHTREFLEAQLDAVAMAQRWEEREALRAALHLNHCPNCDHEWHTPNPRLDAYSDVPEERPVYTLSAATVKTKMRELDAVEAAAPHYEALSKLLKEFPDNEKKVSEATLELTKLDSNRSAYRLYQASLGYDQIRKELTERLAQPELVSYASQIQAGETYEKSLAAYQQALAAAAAMQEKADVAKVALSRFPSDLPVQVATLEAQARRVLVFDQQLLAYNGAFASFTERAKEIAELEADAEGWRDSRAAMADVRSTVKGYLLPSLNKVASHLLNQMTGGELHSLVVDEEFEVKVNDQRLDTLSGAGKDVANLALRLGLGTVLTNQTFSVLMLDEIDQGYDEERVAYTSACLNNLSKTFKQLILISHKSSITSDHRLEL